MENIEAVRTKLVERIFSTKNVNFLQATENLFLSVEPQEHSDKYILSENQKELILLAEEDIKYGRTISDDELRKLDEEWMK